MEYQIEHEGDLYTLEYTGAIHGRHIAATLEHPEEFPECEIIIETIQKNDEEVVSYEKSPYRNLIDRLLEEGKHYQDMESKYTESLPDDDGPEYERD